MVAFTNKQNLCTVLQACQDGHALPNDFNNDPDLFEADMQAVFYREWLFAAPECKIPEPGDFITLQVHNAPSVVVRDPTGEIRAT